VPSGILLSVFCPEGGGCTIVANGSVIDRQPGSEKKKKLGEKVRTFFQV